MAQSWAQRFLIKSSKYLQDAFSEPGVLRTFDEELFNFRAPQATAAFVTFTDSALGGQSTAQVRHSTGECGADAQTSDTGCLVFEGNFSSAIPADAPSEQTPGHYFWLGEYERQVASTIKYRLKGDGRLYGLFLKSDSYVEGTGVDEIWQAFVQTKKDEWQDVTVPVVHFLLTTSGYLTRERRFINLRRVTSLGFSVPGGRDVQQDGPFKLCVSHVSAGYDTDRSSGNED